MSNTMEVETVRRFTVAILIIAVALTVSAAAWASYAEKPMANTVVGVGARAMGMGDAFVAVADDATALYWNAAGLADNKGFAWEAFGIGAATDNVDVLDDLKDLKDIFELDSTDTLTMDDFNLVLDIAQRTAGRPFKTEGSVVSAFAVDNIAIGGYGLVAGLTSLQQSGPSSVSGVASGIGYGGLGIGYGTYINDRTSVGLVIKQATMGAALEVKGFSPGSFVTDIVSESDTDSELTADLGIRYKTEPNVTVGLAIRDITWPEFNLDMGVAQGLTYKVHPSVHVGIAATNDAGDMIVAADIHNLWESSNEPATIHLGVEKTFSPNFIGRAGFSNGDLTFGLTGGIGPFSISLASGTDYEDMAAVSFAAQF